jgi:hypothetical protein
MINYSLNEAKVVLLFLANESVFRFKATNFRYGNSQQLSRLNEIQIREENSSVSFQGKQYDTLLEYRLMDS